VIECYKVDAYEFSFTMTIRSAMQRIPALYVDLGCFLKSSSQCNSS